MTCDMVIIGDVNKQWIKINYLIVLPVVETYT